MLNRFKRILRSRSLVSPMDVYYSNVRRASGDSGPSFVEAQKDFQDINRRYTRYQA